MWLQTKWVLLVAALLAACAGDPKKTATRDDLYTREVRMPDGTKYSAEVAIGRFDMTRGMMFRDSLAADRGMLFINGEPGLFPYWTYQVRIPLDMIWLDQNRIVTEIVSNAEPCKMESAAKCPHFGGHQRSLYILEFNAGTAARHKLKPGDRLDF